MYWWNHATGSSVFPSPSISPLRFHEFMFTLHHSPTIVSAHPLSPHLTSPHRLSRVSRPAGHGRGRFQLSKVPPKPQAPSVGRPHFSFLRCTYIVQCYCGWLLRYAAALPRVRYAVYAMLYAAPYRKNEQRCRCSAPVQLIRQSEMI